MCSGAVYSVRSQHLHPPGINHLGKRLGTDGRAEQKTLHGVAAQRVDELELRQCFHTFSHGMQVERIGEGDDGTHDGGIVAVVLDVAHKKIDRP